MRADVELMLRRDFVEAAAASVTGNTDNGKAVTRVFADTFISHQQTVFDEALAFAGALQQGFLFLLSVFNDRLKFLFLHVEVALPFFKALLGIGNLDSDIL